LASRQRLWCEGGSHYWRREPKPGRAPKSCPRHAVPRGTVELWCDNGQHAWRRSRTPGRLPSSCPDHPATNRAARAGRHLRWIGDLKTCFLLDMGWAFRISVNRFQLKGRGGWRMPLSLAESLGLSEGETRQLKPMNSELVQEVELARRANALFGGPIDLPLRRLDATEGDYAFFCLRGDRYDFVLRSERELDGADSLETLLWCCGLDIHDDAVRHSPWRHLARVLGGEAGGREEVRRRLQARRDTQLLTLLEIVEAEGAVRNPGWIDAWACRAPILPDEHYFVLEGVDHGVRVAVGVVDTSGQPPRGLVRSKGGLLWLDQPGGLDLDEVKRLVSSPPSGLVAAARRSAWSRWLRAEHIARRAALAHVLWTVEPKPDGWWVAGIVYDDLIQALEAAGAGAFADVRAPAVQPRKPYARSVVAFRRTLDAAIRGRLSSIRGDAGFGFAASYASGREAVGASLMDVLTDR